MTGDFREWVARLFQSKARARAAVRRTPRLNVEHVEDRITPANYNWGGVDTLFISLGTDERLDVSETAGIAYFTLTDGGTFTPTNVTAPTDLGTSISFTSAQIASFLGIDDTLDAGGGVLDNDLHFSTGTITSVTMVIGLTNGTSPDDIFFDGGTLSATNVVVLQTSSGAISSLGAAATDIHSPGLTAIAQSAIGDSFGNPLATAVGTLVAQGAGAAEIFVQNAGILTVGGAASAGGNIDISTIDGSLTVTGSVSAGTGTVALTAGGAPGENRLLDLQNNGGAGIVGTGGVTLTADNMQIADTVDAGINPALVQPFEAGTQIDLGGADGPNTLGLTDSELDFVTAAVIQVGNTLAGDITTAGAVDAANTSQLELVTGGGIVDGVPGLDITETRLGLTAVTGIGSAVELNVIAGNLEATTDTGNIRIANFNTVLTLGGVNATLAGVTTTTSGSIQITNTIASGNSSIIVGESVTTAGGGDLSIRTLNATGQIGNVAINAPVSATGGDGDVLIEAEDDLAITAAVTAAGDGNITLIADPTVGPSANAGNFNNTGAGTITATTGDIRIQAGDSITVSSAVSTGGAGTITIDANAAIDVVGEFVSNVGGTVASAGGSILIRGLDIDIGDAVNATVGGGAASRVLLLTRRASDSIQLGTDAGFGLTDADLDRVTADTLQIGSAAQTANIQLTGTITIDPMLVPVMSLITTGAVTDATAADVQDDLTVQSLAIQAGTGVGDPDTINIAVTNLAVANTTSGNGFVSNNLFSAGGPLSITVVDGVAGVHNAGTDIAVSNTGGVMSLLEEVESTGGGNVTLTTFGAGGDIVLGEPNGRVESSGGTGNVTLDATGATSGGQITINGTGGVEVQAASTGGVTVSARAGVTIGANADVQSGNTSFGGNISISANVGVPGGGADITMGAGSNVTTRGNTSLTTDPDFVFTGTAGADIVMDPTAIIKGNGNSLADNKSLTVTLRADGDVVVSTVWADTDLASTAAENILDDAGTADATFIQATDIQLTAGGTIGGAVQIAPSDVISGNTAAPTAAFRGAIDFDLDNLGSLIVTQGAVVVLTGTGGNVQLRQVDDPQDANPEPVRTSDLNFGAASINSDNQLAVISSAGDFLVDSGFVVPSNADLLLATTAGFSVVLTGAVTNPGGMNADTVIVASGSPTASITGTVGGVADVVGPVVNLVTTGGGIGLSPAMTLEINATRLDGSTTGGGAPGGSAFITDTQNGVAVGLFTAGGGDVVLRSLGNNGTTANITAVTPNDNAAEVIANTVTLDTTLAGPVAGPNGQIGLPGIFFEVNANVIFAATNNSSLWVSEVGTGASAGATVGSVTAGTATAFLRVRNGGTITGANTNFVADVVAATVNLSNVAGDTPAGGGFGASPAGPLEINATTLTANLVGTGGGIFVRDTAGGLTLARATTTGGNVSIEAVGGNLVVGTPPAGVTSVVAATGTAALVTSSGGAISSTAPGGVTDVTAASLIVFASGAVGSVATPLQTAVGTLASLTNGGLFLANTGSLIVGPVTLGTLSNSGVVTSAGPVDLTAAGSLTVVGGVTGLAGDVTLTAVDAAGAGQDVVVNPGVTVGSNTGAVTLRGGDTVTLWAGALVVAAGTVTLNVGFNDLDGVGGAVIRGTIDAGTGTPATVGGTGADTVLVDYTGGAILPDGLSFAGGSAADVLQVIDAGGAAAHAYVVYPTGVVRDAGVPILFAADVETVRVVGGNLADAFTVTATAATAIDVQGSTPITGPGDTLTVTNANAAFLTTTGTGSVSGTYDFPAGTADVTFAGIESLDTGADSVSITKTDGIATAIPGTTVTYTVVVTNNATVGLSGIRVQDVVPAAITGASFTADFTGTGSTGNVGPTPGNGIDETLSLAAGGTATYTITGTLNPTTPAGTGTLVNTATATPPVGVADVPGNNTATDTDDVVPTGDVVVTKDNGTLTTVPGTTTTYTIVVSNTGPSTVTVSFADLFPAAITSATRTVTPLGGATGGTAGGGNIADALTLPGGSSVTYVVSAAVSGTATGTLSNTATATILTPGFDQGGSTANDSATDTDTLVPTGDVVVTKTDGVTTVTAGSTTTYTITVSNTGPSTVTVPFTDTFPAPFLSPTWSVVNAGGATGGTVGTGFLADTLTLPAGGTVTYTVTATIDPAAAAGTLTNTATATVSGLAGNNTANDSATDSDVLVAAPDVGVSVSAPFIGKVGTAFTYTLNVSNFGQSTQTNVVLSHTLPVKAIDISTGTSQGFAFVSGGVLTAAIGTLAPGAFATVTVTLTPTGDGSFVLVGTVVGALPETNTGNNAAGAATQVAPYQPLVVAGPGNGGGAEVRVLNADTGALEARFIPFGPFYSFAMSVAQGDVNGDGVPEIIVGSGPGGAARVVVLDVRTGAELRSFFAFEPTVTGGVNVGAGDLDGDGKDEILTGAGAGFGPRVRAFSGATGQEIRSFFAYEASFTGGARVAAGDTNGDGRLDIITGAGGGGSSRVQVFDGTSLAVLQNFIAFGTGLREGVYVTAADTNGDGTAEIVAGAGGGGASHIRVFDGKTLGEKASFFAFAPTARDGVTVGATDRNSDGVDDITAGTGVGVQAQVKLFSGSGAEEAVFNAFDIGFSSGVYVG